MKCLYSWFVPKVQIIIPLSGLLFRQPLDFESRSSFSLHVEVSNRIVDPRFLLVGPFSDLTTVQLQVEDVNEPPVFTPPVSWMMVSEGAPVGTVVGSVSASDPDDSNSPVRWDDELTAREWTDLFKNQHLSIRLSPGTPSTKAPTWSVTSASTAAQVSSGRTNIWTERAELCTTLPSPQRRNVGLMQSYSTQWLKSNVHSLHVQ